MSDVFRIGYILPNDYNHINSNIIWFDTFADSVNDCLVILNAFRGAFKDFKFYCKHLVSKNIFSYEEFKKFYGFE